MEDDETVVTPNVLTFYEHNHEINELHRTFNSIVKTMLLAHHQDDNENMALLKYTDAYYIEQYAQNSSHKSICLSNIGALLFQKKDYYMAFSYFDEARAIQKYRIYDGDEYQEKREKEGFLSVETSI